MLSASYIAKQISGTLIGGNVDPLVEQCASLRSADKRAVALYQSHWPVEHLERTQAALVILEPDVAKHCLQPAIVVEHAINGFEQVMGLLDKQPCDEPTFVAGISSTASIGEQCDLSHSVTIASNVVIGNNVSLGQHVVIDEGACIASNVSIGDHCHIHANAVIAEGVELGSNVRVDCAAIIGGKPFNMMKNRGVWQAGRVLGSVRLADDVVIGANTSIDCGVMDDTVISNGVKIDNLVHIGHDAFIGPHTAIAACAVIGAYTIIEPHCIIGGGSCIAGRLRIAENVTITGASTVTRSLRQASIYSSGTTVQKHSLWRRNVARFHQLDKMIKKVRFLEKRMTTHNDKASNLDE